MKIADKLIDNKDIIQKFLNNLNCDSEKWFVFNCANGKNPTLKNKSHEASYNIMKRNTEMFKCRYLYLKLMKDMVVSYPEYTTVVSTKIDDMDVEFDKYNDVKNGYIRSDIFGDLTDLFSDDRIYTVHYIEALGPVDPHKDPWRYNSNYRNIIYYDNIPDDAILRISNQDVKIQSPQLTNFGNEVHTYQFTTRSFPLKILHIDYEN